ncbi:unnamed protein product, partial [Coregonus sp. 'balchen']
MQGQIEKPFKQRRCEMNGRIAQEIAHGVGRGDGAGPAKCYQSPLKIGCVSFVKSVVGYGHKRKEFDDEPQKCKGKQKALWSIRVNQAPSHIQQSMAQDGQQRHNKVAKYRAKFDPRVTASRVVRVEHRATRQPFTIKMMEVEARKGLEVCESELGVLGRVSHPNVVQLVEVFQSPQRVYVNVGTGHGQGAGHFTERDATRAPQMTLAVVGYLHSLGITHRDLKPENLLYYHHGADSRLLVTDLGLSSFGNRDPGGGE